MGTSVRQLIRGKGLLFIIMLGIGGTFQNGCRFTVISSPSPYIQRFINNTWYERYEEVPHPQSVTLIWSAIVSIYSFGGLCGSVIYIYIGTFGRKEAMIGNSLFSIFSAVIMLTSKWAKSFEMILLAQFLFGISAGTTQCIHVIYLGESSPRKIRGLVTMTSSTFISLGKLFGQFVGLSEILGREDLWNVLLSVSTCFSVVHLFASPFFPEAPRYSLIEKGNVEECRRALQSLWGPGDYKQDIEEMVAEQEAIKGAPPKSQLEFIQDRSIRWQLIAMTVMSCGIMFSGASAITTYSFDIFLKAGVPRENIRYVTLGIGASEVLSSISCGLLIESVGRKPLLWGGFGALSTILMLTTVSLNLKDSSEWVPYSTASLIFLFVIFMRGGPGGVSASLQNETFVQSYRQAAFVFTGIQRWIGSAVLGLIFPFLIDALKSFIFVPFAMVCLLASLYCYFLIPETKGKTLLEISEEFKATTVCWKSPSHDKYMETKL